MIKKDFPTVKEVISELELYNPEAHVCSIAFKRRWGFTVDYGGFVDVKCSDDITKKNCTMVYLNIDDLNDMKLKE